MATLPATSLASWRKRALRLKVLHRQLKPGPEACGRDCASIQCARTGRARPQPGTGTPLQDSDTMVVPAPVPPEPQLALPTVTRAASRLILERCRHPSFALSLSQVSFNCGRAQVRLHTCRILYLPYLTIIDSLRRDRRAGGPLLQVQSMAACDPRQPVQSKCLVQSATLSCAARPDTEGDASGC